MSSSEAIAFAPEDGKTTEGRQSREQLEVLLVSDMLIGHL
jgi:hypothetical protein